MIGAFILFVLWVTGLVVVAIELFGPSGSISSNCDLEVFSRNPKGQTQEVLAYLQQKNICKWHTCPTPFEKPATDISLGQSWRLVFAMGLIGAVFLLWIMIMAYYVFVES